LAITATSFINSVGSVSGGVETLMQLVLTEEKSEQKNDYAGDEVEEVEGSHEEAHAEITQAHGEVLRKGHLAAVYEVEWLVVDGAKIR
jgi:hypothetical protein